MNKIDSLHDDKVRALDMYWRAAATFNAQVAAQAEAVVSGYERKLTDHQAYIRIHGVDPPEIADWKWDGLRAQTR
jgi:phosphoketolase